MYVVTSAIQPTEPKELKQWLSTQYHFNKRLHIEKYWKDEKQNISKHLNKADKVPILLDFLDAQNRVKLLNYIAILPIEDQRKFEFLEWQEITK